MATFYKLPNRRNDINTYVYTLDRDTLDRDTLSDNITINHAILKANW